MKPLAGLIVFCWFALAPPYAADWPHPRGPRTDGRLAEAKVFGGDAAGLSVAWKVPLGSGYSGIALADGKLATAFADKEADWVVLLDAGTGKELWRHRLEDVTLGEDGAADGPLSTPVFGNGLVYALGSRGRLVALTVGEGKEKWGRALAEDFGGRRPIFGFSTTPLVVDDILVVQAGGPEGQSIVGLDAASGKTRWTHGSGKVIYQSPALMTLAGRRQVVAVDGAGVRGLDPASGALLWEQPLGEGDNASSASPSFIGDDRFLVTLSNGGVAYRVAQAGEGFAVKELYRTADMGRNYAPPVYHDGSVFVFRGQILTCLDAATGERRWRSRPPGGDGLILVGDHLVIFGADGAVVVAEASAAEYRERARIDALAESSLSWPAFADGRIFVRNLAEVAAIRPTRETGAAAPAEP